MPKPTPSRLHAGSPLARAALAVAGIAGAALVVACNPSTSTSPVPTDAQDACPLSSSTFASWFEGGTVTANGVVNPANSLDPLTPNCDFYEWTEHMFLWLNSPAPVTYGGGGGRIFTSPTFFDVSPIQPDGNRVFIKHQEGVVPNFNVRTAQVGALGLPVVVDRFHTLFNVEPAPPEATPQVRNVDGRMVDIAHARRGEKGELVLLDSAGNVIRPQVVRSDDLQITSVEQLRKELVARKFIVDRIPVFIALSGGLVEVEQGQSDGGVLEAQKRSLVYYETSVNDVFAYFDTGFNDGAFSPVPTHFPTTAAELQQVTSFAHANGKTLPDSVALAIEVKTAWVKADGLADLDTYVTRTATIPTYDRSNPDEWVPNGQQTVKLAMVAMHVVGSVAQHPEMIWATFTHVGTTPSASYDYNSSSGVKTVPQSTSGTWLLSATGATGPFNEPHMSQPSNSPNIEAIAPHSISPSNTLRLEPWGKPGSSATSNTEVISMNDHVLGMLASGDVRKNYVMIGATWTIPGQAPPSGQVGTNQLANTTMETYQQGGNCFSCHVTSTPDVSHVFRDSILALF